MTIAIEYECVKCGSIQLIFLSAEDDPIVHCKECGFIMRRLYVTRLEWPKEEKQ